MSRNMSAPMRTDPERAARLRADIDASADQAKYCRMLWAQVVAVALEDAYGNLDARTVSSESRGARSARRAEALRWVGGRDFHEVCSLAGLEPDAVLDRIAADALRLEDRRKYVSKGPGGYGGAGWGGSRLSEAAT